jgi:uncharacterized ferritin-like protein (DUF455 family)
LKRSEDEESAMLYECLYRDGVPHVYIGQVFVFVAGTQKAAVFRIRSILCAKKAAVLITVFNQNNSVRSDAYLHQFESL